MLANEDIGANEVFLKVPSKCLINSKTCYTCPDLKPVFDDDPVLFGMNTTYGMDNVMYAYMLYQMGLGEKSYHYTAF
jgi:hypothetical protein